MPETTNALSKKLVESRHALQEFRDASAVYKGGGEVGGDWSKREAALIKDVAVVKSELAALGVHA